jgi:hypothetical protein
MPVGDPSPKSQLYATGRLFATREVLVKVIGNKAQLRSKTKAGAGGYTLVRIMALEGEEEQLKPLVKTT